MKNSIKAMVIASALSLCAVFAGCSGSASSGTSSEPSAQSATDQATVAATEAPVEETTVPLSTNPEDYLTMFDEGSYYNKLLYKDCEYKMPLIKLDSSDAKTINSELEEVYKQCQNDIELYKNQEFHDGTQTVSYTAALNGSVLSLCVERKYPMSVRKYNVANIDVLTGEKLDNSAVLTAAGTTGEQVKSQTKAAIDSYYADKYGSNVGSKSYSKTMSDDNIAAARYYLGDGNSLCAAFDVFFEAGVGVTEGTAKIS